MVPKLIGIIGNIYFICSSNSFYGLISFYFLIQKMDNTQSWFQMLKSLKF